VVEQADRPHTTCSRVRHMRSWGRFHFPFSLYPQQTALVFASSDEFVAQSCIDGKSLQSQALYWSMPHAEIKGPFIRHAIVQPIAFSLTAHSHLPHCQCGRCVAPRWRFAKRFPRSAPVACLHLPSSASPRQRSDLLKGEGPSIHHRQRPTPHSPPPVLLCQRFGMASRMRSCGPGCLGSRTH